MFGVIALITFAAAVVVMVAAMRHWILAVRNRVEGLQWWTASLLARSRLSAQGITHRRSFWRLLAAALGLWLIAGLLAGLALCCPPY
jgi:hypothetical protein